jgi:hypothetical protein
LRAISHLNAAARDDSTHALLSKEPCTVFFIITGVPIVLHIAVGADVLQEGL